mmetsp:Transcript_5582/g.11453  ORF Transcript_5582/g.11453 Transcript_5582/m.11453 type:complete len:256 (-) Transcript_5582:278-1045(-)
MEKRRSELCLAGEVFQQIGDSQHQKACTPQNQLVVLMKAAHEVLRTPALVSCLSLIILHRYLASVTKGPRSIPETSVQIQTGPACISLAYKSEDYPCRFREILHAWYQASKANGVQSYPPANDAARTQLYLSLGRSEMIIMAQIGFDVLGGDVHPLKFLVVMIEYLTSEAGQRKRLVCQAGMLLHNAIERGLALQFHARCLACGTLLSAIRRKSTSEQYASEITSAIAQEPWWSLAQVNTENVKFAAHVVDGITQ